MLAAPLCGRCCGTYEAARKFKAGRREKAERVFNIRPTSIETCDRQSTTLIGNRHRLHASNAACRSCFNLDTAFLMIRFITSKSIAPIDRALQVEHLVWDEGSQVP